MKFVLVLLLVKDLAVSPPWAAGISAEFDDLPACQAAEARLLQAQRPPFYARAIGGCMPKASAEQEKK